MESHVDLKFILQLAGFAVIIVGAGIAWGKHQRQLQEHQKAVDKCDKTDVMTAQRCEAFHERSQEVTGVQLNAIQDTLTDMKKERNKVNSTLGGIAVKLEVLMDRWERQTGQTEGDH